MLTSDSLPRIVIRRAFCQVLKQPRFFGDEAKVSMRQVTGWQWRCTICLEHDQHERIVWQRTATQQGALSAAAEHLRSEHPGGSSW